MASPLTWLQLDGLRKSDGTAMSAAKIWFYVPGTTTQTAVYGDANKTSTLSQPVTANSAGQATVFTDGVVKVVAQDSDGTTYTVERATATAAAGVEVESAYFTGTKTDGSQGAGGKLPASTALDRVGASLGGKDGNYQDAPGGTERALRVVISERGLSVKDRGATGNGSAIDTSAFNSAIAAIKSAGGGRLIVPPGTYMLDAALATIDFNGLLVEGAGFNATILKSTSATANIFTIGSGWNVQIEKLQLTANAASTGYAIQTAGDNDIFQNLIISNFAEGIRVESGAFWGQINGVYFSPASGQFGLHFKDANTRFHSVRACYFSGAGTGIKIADADGRISIDDCYFESLATGLSITSGFVGSTVSMRGSSFASCTTDINIQATGAIGFREYGNEIDTAKITDLAAGSLWGSFEGGRKGADVTAAAAIAPRGGRFFVVTGNTNIDHIETLGRRPGDKITLQFSGTPTVNDNTGGAAANYAPIQLTAAFTASANDSLVLMYDGTDWKEDGRNVL